MPPLAIGNIVKVKDDGSIHWNHQGQVVGFDDSGDPEGNIRVWFGREADHQVFWAWRTGMTSQHSVEPPGAEDQASDARTWNYHASELELCSFWSTATLCNRYFRRMWHHCQEPKKEFVAGASDCDVKGCIRKTKQRILFNMWGTVHCPEVCDEHAAEYHLKCGDVFPWKDRRTSPV
jgi:hypothetical protein